MTETEQKINELEAHLDHLGKRINLGMFGTFIRSKETKEMLSEVRDAVKQDLKELKRIKAREEQILSDARQEADRIIAEAKAEVDNRDIVLQAKERAKEILEKAASHGEKMVNDSQSKAETMLGEAQQLRNQLVVNSYKYVDNLLDEAEKDLLEKQNLLSNSREELRATLNKKMEKIQMS